MEVEYNYNVKGEGKDKEEKGKRKCNFIIYEIKVSSVNGKRMLRKMGREGG